MPPTVGTRCDLSAWERASGGQEIQGHLWLERDFEANLYYIRPCIKNNEQKYSNPLHPDSKVLFQAKPVLTSVAAQISIFEMLSPTSSTQ